MPADLTLFDTLTRSVQPFQPAGPEVTIYVCGVTPYDTTHLGHAFTFATFDVLIRYLRYTGYRVRYVQNITDIDDPLFERARERGESYEVIAADQTARYLEDMRDLNILPADDYPRASQEIPEMIGLVRRLVDTGHAYAVDGHVYFDVRSDPEYGKLSHLDRSQMIEIARERGGNPDDPLRHDPLDFLLWRPPGHDEPRCPSPWGDGLPGWHVECSAMAMKYLGYPIDIHGGGADLVFPHHESEIAQSESALTPPFARYWVHTAMVYMDGEKMSKSLGNMVFARDLLRSHGPNAVRLYLATCHYRRELHWDEGEMDRAAALARTMTAAVTLPPGDVSSELDLRGYRDRVLDRLSDDLDTPGAVATLSELTDAILAERAGGHDVTAAQQTLLDLGGVLGLRLDPQTSVTQ